MYGHTVHLIKGIPKGPKRSGGTFYRINLSLKWAEEVEENTAPFCESSLSSVNFTFSSIPVLAFDKKLGMLLQ